MLVETKSSSTGLRWGERGGRAPLYLGDTGFVQEESGAGTARPGPSRCSSVLVRDRLRSARFGHKSIRQTVVLFSAVNDETERRKDGAVCCGVCGSPGGGSGGQDPPLSIAVPTHRTHPGPPAQRWQDPSVIKHVLPQIAASCWRRDAQRHQLHIDRLRQRLIF